jgi:anti-anti-sigma factor
MSEGAVLEVSRREVSGAAVLRAAGEVDLTNADELQRAIEETIAPAVVLDLEALTYLDSSGIRAIERGYRRLLGEQRSLAIVCPPKTAAGWTFRVAGFDPRLLRESVDEALALVQRDGS